MNHQLVTSLRSRKEAAQFLGVEPNTLAVWACSNRYSLPYVRVGRLAKYRQADLDAFVQANVINGGTC